MKAKDKILGAMLPIIAGSFAEDSDLTHYDSDRRSGRKKPQLTSKQKKSRAKSKRARKARRKNR